MEIKVETRGCSAAKPALKKALLILRLITQASHGMPFKVQV